MMVVILEMTTRCAGLKNARETTLLSLAITAGIWMREEYGKTVIGQTLKICRAIEITTTAGLPGWDTRAITAARTAAATSRDSGTRRHRALLVTTKMMSHVR